MSGNTGIHHYQLDEMEARLAAEAAINRREAAEKEAERVVRRCEARMAEAEAEAEGAEKTARERIKAAQHAASEAIAASRQASKDARLHHEQLTADLLGRENAIRARISQCMAVARSQVGRGKKLKGRVAELDRRAASIAQTVERGEADIQALHKRRAEIDAVIAALQAKAAEERSQTDGLSRQRADTERSLEQTRDTLAHIQGQVQVAEGDLKSVMLRVHEETVHVVRQREEQSRLTGECDMLRHQLAQLQQAVEVEKRRLAEQQDMFRKEVDAAEDRLSQVRQAASVVANRLGEGEQTLTDTRDAIRAAIQQAEQRCEDLWAEAGRARQAALDAEQRRLDAERENMDLSGRLLSLRRAVEEAEQEKRRTHAMIDDQIATARQELVRLGHLGHLEQKVDDDLQLVRDLSDQYVDLQDLSVTDSDDRESGFGRAGFAWREEPAPASIQDYAARLSAELDDELDADSTDFLLGDEEYDADMVDDVEQSFLSRLALREGR